MSSEQLPKYVTDAIKECNTRPFSNLSSLLETLSTIPTTTVAVREALEMLKQCQKNTDANAGHVEVEAAKIMFERSFCKYKLRYINVFRYSDSRTYLALSQDKVYGDMMTKKQECVNHVKKRIGTSSSNLPDEHKSKGSD